MKRLVLLDLDKTLINEQYQPTVPDSEVNKAVAACENAGISIGLCSDSPLSLLQYWSERLGISGPLVFERGAGVYYSVKRERHIMAPEATSWFSELRRCFIEKTMQRLPRWVIYVGDNTAFIGAGQRFPGIASHAVLVSGIREQSFGAHVRSIKNTSGELAIDSDSLRIIREETETIARLLTKEELDIDENPEYGVLIVHAKRTEKRNGVQFLLEHEQPDVLAVIGDSMTDFMDDNRVVQCAVGNAREEYKAHCTYVASATYTAGVLEVFQHLTK